MELAASRLTGRFENKYEESLKRQLKQINKKNPTIFIKVFLDLVDFFFKSVQKYLSSFFLWIRPFTDYLNGLQTFWKC